MYRKCLNHIITWWRWYHENSVNSQRNAICSHEGADKVLGSWERVISDCHFSRKGTWCGLTVQVKGPFKVIRADTQYANVYYSVVWEFARRGSNFSWNWLGHSFALVYHICHTALRDLSYLIFYASYRSSSGLQD